MRTALYALAVIVAILFGARESLAQNAALPKVWRGEIIEADQGLVSLYAIMIDTKVSHRNGSFSFLLKGRRNKLVYSFSAHTQEAKLPPNQFWKIREDVYDLVELTFVDESGKPRKWRGPYPKPLIVTPKSLSSLGMWYLVTLKDGQFKILLKPQPMKVPLDRWKGSVLSVTDGFSGNVLSSYVPPSGPQGQGFRRVLRGVRSIQMVYSLDLFKFNTYSPEMAKVFQTNDADIRSCYTDLLDKDPQARGKLIYSFVYSGSDQGIKSLKIKQSTIRSSEFLECLYFKLRGLTFPLKQSLAGELSFQFNVVE